jgi:hypothetical protein
MAKFKIWVSTNKIGSKCERVIEIPDGELEDLDGFEREKFIEEWMMDELFASGLWEWGYDEQ